MATSQQLRSDIAELVEQASVDLAVLFRLAETESIEALRDVLPDLIATYGLAAATVGADWYDDYRAEHSAPRRFTAIPAAASDRGAQALIGWAVSKAVDDASFKALILGGTQRRIFDHSRLTVMGSSIADPSSRGWRRVGIGECDFCKMLLGRGAVYSEATVHFEAHDNCQCGAEPDFT